MLEIIGSGRSWQLLERGKLMAEAKGRGYDTAVMRKIIALRKRDINDVAEEQAVLEMYAQALGMTLA